MKLWMRLTALLLIVLLAYGSYVAYRDRFRIAARIWHWRHGYVSRIGEYDVPVPAHWLPKYDVPGDLLLYNTERFALVSILPRTPVPTPDLTPWESVSRQMLEARHVDHITQHTIKFDSQMVSCIGGAQFSQLLKISAPSVISLDCQSTGNIHLRFTGQDSELETFYSIASQIKEHK